jgi:hypothetical protein
MIGKILLLPFWIIKKIVGLGFGTITLIFSFVGKIGKLLFGTRLGVLVILVLGVFLGRKFIKEKMASLKEEG